MMDGWLDGWCGGARGNTEGKRKPAASFGVVNVIDTQTKRKTDRQTQISQSHEPVNVKGVKPEGAGGGCDGLV